MRLHQWLNEWSNGNFDHIFASACHWLSMEANSIKHPISKALNSNRRWYSISSCPLPPSHPPTWCALPSCVFRRFRNRLTETVYENGRPRDGPSRQRKAPSDGDGSSGTNGTDGTNHRRPPDAERRRQSWRKHCPHAPTTTKDFFITGFFSFWNCFYYYFLLLLPLAPRRTRNTPTLIGFRYFFKDFLGWVWFEFIDWWSRWSMSLVPIHLGFGIFIEIWIWFSDWIWYLTRFIHLVIGKSTLTFVIYNNCNSSNSNRLKIWFWILILISMGWIVWLNWIDWNVLFNELIVEVGEVCVGGEHLIYSN